MPSTGRTCLNAMGTVLPSLFPVFLLIASGYGLKHTYFRNTEFWLMLERMIYFVLFPALILDTLSNANLREFNVLPMAIALSSATLAVSFLVICTRKLINVDGPAFASIFMGATRFNTYVGIGAAGVLYGESGLTLAALSIAVLVPLVNFLSVLVLAQYSPQATERGQRNSIILPLITNPLIIASGLGIIVSAASWQFPKGIDLVIHALAQSALPLGLLAVGAGLNIQTMKTAKLPLAWSGALKLIVMPIAMAFTCALFGVTGLPAHIAVLFASLPSASTAYVLARQMGGDAPLMAGIITITTLIATFTMPLVLAYLEITTKLA